MKNSKNEVSTFVIKDGDDWKNYLYTFLVIILFEVLLIPLFLKYKDNVIFYFIGLSSILAIFFFHKLHHSDRRKILLAIDREGIRISDKNNKIESYSWQIIESVDVRPLLELNEKWNLYIFVKLEGAEEVEMNITPYCFINPRHAIDRAIISCSKRNDLFHYNVPPFLRFTFMTKKEIMSYREK